MKPLDERVEELVKQYPHIWPTKASVWSYIRGALRRGMWEKSPIKFDYKNKSVSSPPDGYTGRAKSGTECALTGEWTGKSKLEVDHIEGHKSLLCEDDVINFIIHLLPLEGELQLVDKEAHKVKSYAERMGITYEQALIRKDIIAFKKLSLQQMQTKLQSLSARSGKTKTECVKIYTEIMETQHAD